MMNRRTFLKIMLGTVPGMAFTGLQAAAWPRDQGARPESAPVSICIDRRGLLCDPGYPAGPVTRRDFYGIDGMTRRERYDLYCEHPGEQWLKHYLSKEEEDFEDVKVSFSRLDELDSSLEAYFTGELDPEEASFRETLEKSRYWIGAWLHDHLPADALQQLDLAYVEAGPAEAVFCAVRYTGSLQQINAVLFACGLNAVCFRGNREQGTVCLIR